MAMLIGFCKYTDKYSKMREVQVPVTVNTMIFVGCINYILTHGTHNM